MKNKTLIKYLAVIFTLCILVLLPLFIISIYNRPSADDFSYALNTREAVVQNQGFWGVIKSAFQTDIEFYNTWQGLYSSAFLLALQPAIFGEKFYALSSFAVIFSAYLFTFLSVHILNKMFFKKSVFFSATVSLVLLTFLMVLLPSAVQGIYWYNGAVNYMPWAFSNIFNICLLVRIKDYIKSPKGIIYLIISTVISFLTSGGNHVTAFANILFLLIISVYFIFKKRFYPLFSLITAVAGFIIMYIAPGTAARAICFTQQPVFETICEVLKYLRDNAYKFINIQWLICVAAITPLSIKLANKLKTKLSIFFPFISIILSIIVICGMLAVPYFSMGHFGEARILNVIWITFMFLSWFNYTLFVILAVQSGIIDQQKILSSKNFSAVSAFLVCTSIFMAFISTGAYGDSNSYKALNELISGKAQEYCAQMDSRFEQFNDDSLSEVKVAPLKVKSELLFFSDMSTDPNDWPNNDMSKYYNKIIYLDEASE